MHEGRGTITDAGPASDAPITDFQATHESQDLVRGEVEGVKRQS